MRTLILYKTKYGSTKQYSEWLHEEIPNSEIFSADVFNPKRLNEFDTVLLGSCIYMGDIKGKRFLTNNWDVLNHKNIYLFFLRKLLQLQHLHCGLNFHKQSRVQLMDC